VYRSHRRHPDHTAVGLRFNVSQRSFGILKRLILEEYGFGDTVGAKAVVEFATVARLEDVRVVVFFLSNCLRDDKFGPRVVKIVLLDK
jgi:hypothetical protein